MIGEAASRVLDQDETPYSIVKDWNERGDLTRKGAPWKHSVLRNVLTNLALIGPNSAGVQNCWSTILDQQTFDRLTERLTPDSARRTNPLGVKSSKHALGGGLIVCGRCGKPLHPVARQGAPTKLVCRAFANGDHENQPKRENGTSEGRVSIDAAALEAHLFERCLAHLQDDKFWDDVKRKRETADSNPAKLRAERDARQGERDRAGRAFVAGIMSERDAQIEVARLDSEIAHLTQQIDHSRGGPVARDVWHERRDVLDRFDDWTPGERRLFFRAMVARVSVRDWPAGLPTTTLPRKGESGPAFEARRVALARAAMEARVVIEWSR
ncbi:recombinase family protein [Microbacterium sp. Leaf179]|uniref:recombinase family protein n=1 Tax=Microbacterium sp. Leaf179 TaxID=1736288 RepID=UPI000A7C5163|nr:recombinase family protein [Microbacterium sp. Leaf179]